MDFFFCLIYFLRDWLLNIYCILYIYKYIEKKIYIYFFVTNYLFHYGFYISFIYMSICFTIFVQHEAICSIHCVCWGTEQTNLQLVCHGISKALCAKGISSCQLSQKEHLVLLVVTPTCTHVSSWEGSWHECLFRFEQRHKDCAPQ